MLWRRRRRRSARRKARPVELRLLAWLLRWSLRLVGLALLLLWRLGRRLVWWRRAEDEPLPADAFYRSYAWRSLRVDVIEANREAYGVLTCECCHRQEDGAALLEWHVDHVKPRSAYPELALEFDNCQLLCGDCNHGKLDRYETDWRPPERPRWLPWSA